MDFQVFMGEHLSLSALQSPSHFILDITQCIQIHNGSPRQITHSGAGGIRSRHLAVSHVFSTQAAIMTPSFPLQHLLLSI